MKKKNKKHQQLLQEIDGLRQKNFELSVLKLSKTNATEDSRLVEVSGTGILNGTDIMLPADAEIDPDLEAFFAAPDITEVSGEYRDYSNKIFLANLSHNIRTAMNGILGLTDVVLNSALEPRQQQYLSMVKNSASFLLVFLNDIVDYSKLETGSVKFLKTSFNLREMVETIIDLLTLQLNEKNLDLHLFIHQEVPEFFEGDNERLRRILLNLLKNIVRLTDKGEITFEVKLVEQNGNEAILHFSILNTGHALSNAMFQADFENFTKMDLSSTNDLLGIDMGLNVAGKLLDLMGARIWRENQESMNVFNFSLSLPVQSDLNQHFKQKSNSIQGTKILVLIKNSTDRLIVSEILEACGSQVRIFAQAETVNEVIHDHEQFDLILLDNGFFRKNCTDLVKEIREKPGQEKLPLILLVSNDSNHPGSALTLMPKVSILSRPIRQNQLLTLIRNSFSDPAHDSDMARLAEVEGCHKILLVEDVYVNQKVALALLENTGLQVDVASEGEEAVNAVKENRYALVLMDVQMPKMDGITATKLIRKTMPAEILPIIAMTAHTMKGDKEECLAAGMNDYISKPIDPREFYRLLRTWLIDRKKN